MPPLVGAQSPTVVLQVIDNGSTDGTPEEIACRWPDVHVKRIAANVGFGAAVNIGASLWPRHDVLALNVDTIPSKHAIAILARALSSTPRVAVAAPRLVNADGSLQRSSYRFPTIRRWCYVAVGLDRLSRQRGTVPEEERRPALVDWAAGAALLVRREAWDEIGGFDPAYRFFVEEVDLQRRLADAGWLVVLEPRAAIVHFGGAHPIPPRRFALSHDGWERYFGVRGGRGAQIRARSALVLLAFTRCLAWAIIAMTRPRSRATALRWTRMFAGTATISLVRLAGAARRHHQPYIPQRHHELPIDHRG